MQGARRVLTAMPVLAFALMFAPAHASDAEFFARAVATACAPKWGLVSIPSPGQFNYLFDVAALSASDAWAVGFADAGLSDFTLTEHWDGQVWTVVRTRPRLSTFA